MEIAEALRRSRNEGGKSQEYMAFELGVSRRTIQHWESGVSEPSIGMAMEWFRLVEKNPLPFLLQHIFPNMDRISGKDDDEKLKRVLLDLVAEMPPESVRQLLYLFYGDHGSSPRAVMQMVTAHLQTPIKDRVTQAHVIAVNYEIARKKGVIARPDHIQPDMEFLKSAIAAGEAAAIRDAAEYSISGRPRMEQEKK